MKKPPKAAGSIDERRQETTSRRKREETLADKPPVPPENLAGLAAADFRPGKRHARFGIDLEIQMFAGHRVEEEAVHHLVDGLVPFLHRSLRIGIERVEGRVVIVGDDLELRPLRELS